MCNDNKVESNLIKSNLTDKPRELLRFTTDYALLLEIEQFNQLIIMMCLTIKIRFSVHCHYCGRGEDFGGRSDKYNKLYNKI